MKLLVGPLYYLKVVFVNSDATAVGSIVQLQRRGSEGGLECSVSVEHATETLLSFVLDKVP